MTATNQQIKLFFVLIKEGGWNKEKTTKRVKQMFKLHSLTDITAAQISSIIDDMQQKIEIKKEKARQQEVINQLHVRMYDPLDHRLLYSTLAAVGQNQGVVMYFPMGTSERAVDKSGLDFNLPTTRFDIQNHLMYHYDIFTDSDYPESSYLIDWDNKKLQWIAYDTKTDKPKELYKFKNPLVIGNVYTGIKN